MNLNKQKLIHHFLEKSAEVYPGKIALIHEDIRATYSEINRKANQIAHWLIDSGVKQGDRVVIILYNSLEYVISYYGILKAGAVTAALSTDLKPDGLNPLIAELEPKVIITSKRFERLLNASDNSLIRKSKLIIQNYPSILKSNRLDITEFNDASSNNGNSNPNINIGEDTLASIIYTSGSTGKPKGVMLSHKNIVSNTHSICEYLHLTDEDIQMIVLPFFYVMGKSLLNTHFAVGGTAVINNKFAYPATVINQMIQEKVTGFSGVPSTYAYLLHRSPLGKLRDKLGSLQYCSQAGGHMSRQIKEELRDILPTHTKIYIMYGATEAAARLTYLEPEQYEKKIESIGESIPGVTIKILDSNGEELPVGEKGELVCTGPNIMQGYWRDEDSTKQFLDKNGYHTGDIGYQDDDGFFYITGRKDNILKVGGHRINPQEIEDAIMETKFILETIVLGVPDPLLGNKLVAIACPMNSDCTETMVMNECSKKLPKYKMPSEIKLIKALPKSSNGKIDRNKCMQLVGS